MMLGLALAGMWLFLSGEFTLHSRLIAGLGLVSVVFVVLVCRRMGIVDREGVPVHIFLRFLAYLPWLSWQIIVSNFGLAKRILSRRIPIEPTVVRWRARQKTDLGRVILANSITLTPGTFTIEAEGGRLTVHAIDVELSAIEEGEMDRRVRAVEGKS